MKAVDVFQNFEIHFAVQHMSGAGQRAAVGHVAHFLNMCHKAMKHGAFSSAANGRCKLWVGSLTPGLSCQHVQVYWEGSGLWSCCWWAGLC